MSNKLYKELPTSGSTNEYKFNYLFTKYKTFVLGVCKRHIKNHQVEDAEDIASNVWTQVWLNINKFDFEHKYLKNYIMRTAVFAAINTQKKVGNRVYFDVDSDNINLDSLLVDDDGEINEYMDILLFQNNIATQNDTFTKTSISEYETNYGLLIKKLEKILTKEQIKIIELQYFENYNYREIGKLLGIKMKYAIHLAHDAREKIRLNSQLFK